YAHANDGLSVGAYCGRDIQPVVAGVDSYLKAVLQQREDRPYALRLVMFSGGQDNSSIMRWLDAWRARWQEAEFSAQREYYARCRISIAHRVVPEGGRREQFAKLLKETPLDVMLLTDFGEVGESRFEEVSDDKLPDDGFRQFPILEKTCCAILAGGRHRVRERVLSQRRFALASLNAEVLNRVQAGTLPPERTHVVISQTQFDAWDPVLDAAHECSTWVVCLDPAVDEQLLLRTGAAETRKREIIGFGTGVGAHGESNYTISTEQFRLTDIERRIGQQLAALFERWDDATREQIAETLVRTASQMGGLSLVKATGPSQYVRDYIAYSTLCHLLTNEEGYYCNQMVSLDAFRHWFGDSIPGLRPDLLRLRARIINGLVHIEADVLECKLAHRSEHHLGEALHQVEAGLQRLVARFRPRESGKAIGVNDRPDQRYWWMQLHRLLASRGHTTKPQYAETLSALERLSDGFFSISWRGAVVAFWSDEDGPSWQVEAEWPVQVEGKELEVRAFTAGREMLRRICLEKTTEDPLQPLPSLRRTSDPTAPNVSTVDGEDKPATPRARPQADQAMTEELAGAKLSVEDKNVREGAVERVLLGRTTPGDRPVYWEFGHPELPNRHILVFGASGTGKTYTIQALLCELAAAGQNAVIVDYTNGFITGQLDEVTKLRLAPTQHVVRKEPLPVNPFRQQTDYVDDEPLPEDEAVTAQRVTGVFSEVYLLGDQQKSALYAAIRDGLKAGTGTFDLKKLVMRLESLNARGGGTGAAAATVLSRITPFVDMEPFGPEDAESWEKLYTDAQSRCHVIQLAGFS
ncbi:MAG TPA: DUF853 family protein, partial [Anaerolineae bacterium]|nr:DUF853 family protein [Anaerolineae bacterium]